ncbi:DUF58 domain-containing protein [Candidatus Poribacteria bacterium]|nr:DUF58 domain-containing protein [Candidatus Poribacteria bacterium]
MSRPDVDVLALKSLRIVSRARPRAARHGERIGVPVGGRIEFTDYRAYAPGDDLRAVDWNVAARTDRLYVKQALLPVAMPVHLLVDVTRSMAVGSPAPLDYARGLAWALSHVALSHGDTVTVAGFAAAAQPIARTSGTSGLARIERALTGIEAGDGRDVGRALRGYALGSAPVGTVVILSDMMDVHGIREGIRALAGKGNDVIAVHLVAPQVEAPAIPGAAEVVDAETGASREIVWDDDTRRLYDDGLRRFLDEAEHWCASRRVRYARIRTDASLNDVIHRVLRTSGVVG